jgi:hypothetical protein
MTEMTELEIARNTRDLIQHALGCSFTVFTSRQRRLALQLLDVVRVRVAELEAAEKEPEKPHLTNREALADLDGRVATLEESADMVADFIRELRTDLKAHQHHNGDSGKCYYP